MWRWNPLRGPRMAAQRAVATKLRRYSLSVSVQGDGSNFTAGDVVTPHDVVVGCPYDQESAHGGIAPDDVIVRRPYRQVAAKHLTAPDGVEPHAGVAPHNVV